MNQFTNVVQAQQLGANVATPKTESVGEILNTLINVAGSVVQSSGIIADAIGGSPEHDKGAGNANAPAPSALIDQLRMVRYMLNEAEGNLSRARAGLGA